MNEELDRPVETEDIIEMDPEDFKFDDTVEEGTNVEEPKVEEVDKPVETDDKGEQQKELDYTPLFNDLSKKIKFKDEEIKIDNLDDVITNYQKGKNYDTLKSKLDSVENSEEMQFIRELAKREGMDTKTYIQAVKQAQVEQERLQEKNQYDELVQSGVSEDLAKQIIENNRLAREYKQEKLKKEEQTQANKLKEEEEKQYLEFLNTYPDVKAEDIPKEVFIKGKEIGLTHAYTKYQNEQLQKQIDELKNVETNKKKAPVTKTTSYGSADNEVSDPFLEGFDSVE